MSQLSIELNRNALRVGESLVGVVMLTLDSPRRLRRLTVQAAGHELLGATPRYRPAVYRYPVQRPWGRTRSGARRVDFELEQRLVDGPVELEPGRWSWSFALELPADALPTYGGLAVQVEHDLTARASFEDGAAREAWAPLHLWAAPSPPAPAEPFVLTAPEPSPAGLLDRLTAGLRAPLELRLTGPSRVLALGSVTSFEYSIDNPRELDLRHLRLELRAAEKTRHRAATEVGRYTVDERVIQLAAARRASGAIDWVVPAPAAPSLKSKRFSVAWELVASVTVPWAPGVSGSAELTFVEAPD